MGKKHEIKKASEKQTPSNQSEHPSNHILNIIQNTLTS